MYMKKRFLALIVALVMVMSILAACGKGSGSNSGNASSGEEVEIKVWLTPQWKGVIDATEDGADYDSFFKHAGERFAKEYTDDKVKVSVEVVAADQRDELLNVNLNGGTPPDIFFDSVFAMGDYVHRGALVSLNDIVDEDATTDIAEGYWENVKFGDDVYFYPFSNNPGTLVYNADMFKAAGLEKYVGDEQAIQTWTLEDYEKILKALKEKLPKDQYPNANPMGLYALNNQGDTWNLAYLRMFGNQFFNDKGLLAVNDEQGIEAAEWLQKIYKAGYTNPGAESVSSNDVNSLFQNQQLAISFTNPVLFANAKADMDNGKMKKFDMRLANIPSSSGDPLTFTYVTGAAVFNTQDERRIKASKAFVKFISTDEELVVASKNGVPVRESVIKKVKKENPYFEAYADNAQYVFNFTGNVAGYNQLRQVLYPELQALFTGSKTPAEMMKDYEEKGNKVIEEAQAGSIIQD